MTGIDIVENSLYNVTSEGISKEELERLRNFQEKASEFLRNLKSTMELESRSISLRSFATQLVQLNMNKTKANTTQFNNIMGYLADFEHALNVFLNRTEYLTYVSQDGKLYLYDQVGVKQIYEKMQVQGKSGRGRIKADDFLGSVEAVSRGEFIKRINDSARNKCRVYQEAVRRWNKKPDSTSKKGMRYKAVDKNLTKTFYFRAHEIQHLLYWSVTTRPSTIAEAYVNEVVNDENSDFNNENLEWSLSHLNMQLKGAFKPNTIGGAIKGDVTSSGLFGEIHYAVKSGTGFWSSPRIKQYIALAYNILLFDKITPEMVKQHLKSLSNIRLNSIKIFQHIVGQVTEELKDEIVEKTNQLNFMLGV